MSFHNQKVRKFPPSAMWRAIQTLYNEQISDLETAEDITTWQENQKPVWDEICGNLREMERILGSVRIFDSLRFHETLAMQNDPHLAMSGTMIQQPILEDLLILGGLHDTIEDFFLSQYGKAPCISRKDGKIVSVLLPGFIQRIILGYPSAKRVQKDFKKVSAGLWSIEFETLIIGREIRFGVFLPEYDKENVDEDYVRVAVDLLNHVTGGGIAYE